MNDNLMTAKLVATEFIEIAQFIIDITRELFLRFFVYSPRVRCVCVFLLLHHITVNCAEKLENYSSNGSLWSIQFYCQQSLAAFISRVQLIASADCFVARNSFEIFRHFETKKTITRESLWNDIYASSYYQPCANVETVKSFLRSIRMRQWAADNRMNESVVHKRFVFLLFAVVYLDSILSERAISRCECA